MTPSPSKLLTNDDLLTTSTADALAPQLQPRLPQPGPAPSTQTYNFGTIGSVGHFQPYRLRAVREGVAFGVTISFGKAQMGPHNVRLQKSTSPANLSSLTPAISW